MTHQFRTTVLILAGLTAACGSQTPATEQRPAETAAATSPQAGPTVPPAAPAAAARAAAPPPAAGPSESQKFVTADQAQRTADQYAKDKAEQQRLVEQQQAISEKLAETNARLQQQVDQLKPREFTLPAGTAIPVRTTAELSTAKLANGSTFDALLESDLTSGGTVLAKAGARVHCFVASSDPGGRVKGKASLTVGVRSIVGVKGNVITVTTDTYTSGAENTKKKDAARTGIATGVGAIIGGVAGGGKGAAIGAGAGAAAGVGTTLATRGAAAVIPAEELLEFRLTSPVTVVVQP